MNLLRTAILMLWIPLLLLPQRANARRYIIAIAANRGGVAETPLRFTHRDARRIRRVFLDVGEIQAADSVLLTDPSLSEVRSALNTISDGRMKPGDTVVIYLSGHMDDESIHLGPERFTFKELFESCRATGASLRIFILDGCRSGSVTLKGVQRVGSAKILRPQPLPSQGEVVLTSTAPGEDALESNRLAGSFFTHFLVTGLRGAADGNRDGKITVEEVVSFAHDKTVYATAGSPTGSQHPAFKLDLAGTNTTVLTKPGSSSYRGARLQISKPREGIAYLLNLQTNQLEAEVSLDRPGVLVVPSGAYRIRVATSSKVEEGHAILEKAATTDLDSIDLEEVPLLTLLRKGEGPTSSRWMLRLELEGGVGDPYGHSGLFGVRATGSVEWRSVSLFLELTYHHVGLDTDFVDRYGDAPELYLNHVFGFGAGISHPLDLGSVNLVFGLGLEGYMYMGKSAYQVTTRETKYIFAVGIVPVIRIEVPLGSRLLLTFSLREAVRLFNLDNNVHITFSAALGLGWVF
jgi:hypothetical protein